MVVQMTDTTMTLMTLTYNLLNWTDGRTDEICISAITQHNVFYSWVLSLQL